MTAKPLWHPPIRRYERVAAWLVGVQRRGRLGKLIHRLMVARGTDIWPGVEIGPDLMLPHAGIGVVVHPDTKIGRGVIIFTNVTVGRADPWVPYSEGFGGFVIEDHAMLCAGSAILNKGEEPLTIGEGAVVGANAVVSESVPPWEIWAGAPARKVGERERPSARPAVAAA
jgi:serine O-acetyltransferase